MGKSKQQGYSGYDRNDAVYQNNQSTGNHNRGYQGELPIHPSSSRDKSWDQMQPLSPMRQTPIQMQPMGQRNQTDLQMQSTGSWGQPAMRMQPFGQQMWLPSPNEHCAVQPPNNEYYLHMNAPPTHTANVMYVNGPADQYIVRDTSTPMPSNRGIIDPEYTPPIQSIIFKRIVSTLFILLDICLNWIQYSSWVGNFEGPDWLNFLETVNSLKGTSLKTQCKKGSPDLTNIFLVFIVIGTVYGLMRMVNMIGETMIEYQKQKPSETDRRCKGFQLIHGWIETLLDFLIDDFPQVILLVVFTCNCHVDYTSMGKILVWIIIKEVKNNVRNSTCKQKYKPCCYECRKPCCDECCNKPCCDDCCKCCREPCCEGCCSDVCCDMSDCSCKRENGCFGEIYKDPDWAYKLFESLQSLLNLLFIAIIVISVLKDKGVISEHQEL